MRASLCFGNVENLESHEGLQMRIWAYVVRALVSQAHPSALPLAPHVPLGALKPGSFGLTPSRWLRCRGARAGSGRRPHGWCGAAVSAENLKPIIKSTVSQSAFYYSHAGNSKQCQ